MVKGQKFGNKKTVRKTKGETNDLVKLMVESKGFKNVELNENPEKVVKYEDAFMFMKEYEQLIRTQKQNIMNLVYKQI